MIYSKLLHLFKKDRAEVREPDEVSNADLLDEIRELKKVFRRQSVSIDLLKKELVEKLDRNHLEEIGPFLDLTDTLFHFERSIRDAMPMSTPQEEALAILWKKLETLLLSAGIEVIHKAGIEFDSRRYEAVETLPERDGSPFVREVLQPGYLYNGNVIKPAKVLLERKESESRE
jgi:molecular chaperone GrpE (heat shock protein)